MFKVNQVLKTSQVRVELRREGFRSQYKVNKVSHLKQTNSKCLNHRINKYEIFDQSFHNNPLTWGFKRLNGLEMGCDRIVSHFGKVYLAYDRLIKSSVGKLPQL